MLYLYALIPVGALSAIYLIRKLREFQWGWVRTNYSLEDKIYIVTGANTGLGYETTKALAARGATIIMACRNVEKANQALVNIRRETANGHLVVLQLDLASFQSIKEFAAKIKNLYPKFDCLINNAGIAIPTNETTKENIEIQFGTNHLGHFLLTDCLKNNIKQNSSRIVVVSSMMHVRGMIDFENLGKSVITPSTTRMNTLYNDSKLANFYFAIELYKKGYDVHILCPGLCYTDLFRDYHPKWYHFVLFSPVIWLALRSAKQGAQNIIYCTTDNENNETTNPATGYLVRNLKQTKSKAVFDDAISEKLWIESAKMCAIE